MKKRIPYLDYCFQNNTSPSQHHKSFACSTRTEFQNIIQEKEQGTNEGNCEKG
jgi:hypothetical protein